MSHSLSLTRFKDTLPRSNIKSLMKIRLVKTCYRKKYASRQHLRVPGTYLFFALICPNPQQVHGFRAQTDHSRVQSIARLEIFALNTAKFNFRPGMRPSVGFYVQLYGQCLRTLHNVPSV